MTEKLSLIHCCKTFKMPSTASTSNFTRFTRIKSATRFCTPWRMRLNAGSKFGSCMICGVRLEPTTSFFKRLEQLGGEAQGFISSSEKQLITTPRLNYHDHRKLVLLMVKRATSAALTLEINTLAGLKSTVIGATPTCGFTEW